MPTLTIMTCGTSLITNGAISIDEDLPAVIRTNANAASWDEIADNHTDILTEHLQQREQRLISANDSEVRRLSAELNGLLAWQEANRAQSDDHQNEYWLLATDTVLGEATARMIQRWLENKGHHTQVISQSGLRTAKLAEFRQALSALTEQLVKSIKGYQNRRYHINFNLTGGFKGINGFLQALATVYADQTYYLFEGSSELLYIPRLPYKLNAEQIVTDNLITFRRLANDMPISAAKSDALPDIWLFEIDGRYILSEWSTLIWQDTKTDLYKQNVLDSPSDCITITQAFIDSCKKADTSIIKLINERIDDLAFYLESGSTEMLQSLDVKALQTKKYKDQNMYECDLDNHWRIFMIKKGHHMTLETLHEALH